MTARSGARIYVLRRFLRRHWLGLAAATGLFLAMAAALVAISREEQKTRSEARRAESVQSFMIDVFRTNSSQQPDPVKARQTTARELLDRGAQRIESSLPDAPLEKRNLLRVFADLYNDLALNPDELRLRRQIVDLSRTLDGNDSKALATDLLALAGAMTGANATNEAVRALTEAKAILDRRKDTTSELRGRVLLKLAEAESFERQHAAAEESARESPPQAPSASYNNALTMTQSRSTVRSVTPKATAVSASEKPAK